MVCSETPDEQGQDFIWHMIGHLARCLACRGMLERSTIRQPAARHRRRLIEPPAR
jgi:hypothetical protein